MTTQQIIKLKGILEEYLVCYAPECRQEFKDVVQKAFDSLVELLYNDYGYCSIFDMQEELEAPLNEVSADLHDLQNEAHVEWHNRYCDCLYETYSAIRKL